MELTVARASMIEGVLGDETAPTAPGAGGAGVEGRGGGAGAVGDEVPRYLLLDRIGSGGMGAVYAAYDRLLDRKVAYKVLHEGLLGGRNQERLLREAQAMAKLAHPNVVPVFDAGERGGRVFLVMELVSGQTVAAWCTAPRTALEIAGVFCDAARGLAAMHAAGLVHRDVKPSNILVDRDGRGRIADLGLAHGADAGAGGAAEESGFAGTPAYMAPEQLRAERPDARADQFGLCASLFEALHGERAFSDGGSDGSPAERLAAIARGPRVPVRDVPEWLSAAVARGLALDPAARFPDLPALVRALTPPPRWWRRWGLAGGAAVAAAAVAVAVLVARSGPVPAAPAGPTCDGAVPALGEAWSAERRGAVAAALGGSVEGRAAAERLDAYAARWQHARTNACHAALEDRAWPAGMLERAAVCLDRGRRELRGVVAALASGGERAHEKAADLVAGLWPPTACGDPDYLATHVEVLRDPATAARRDDLAAQISDASRDLSLGDLGGVERRLATLAPEVDALGDRSLSARLALVRGDLARERDDLAGAARYQTDAYVLARSARDPEATALAASALIWHHGYFQEDAARARDWGQIAAAEASTLGDDPVAAKLHHALGALADRRGELREAQAHFHRAVELARRHHGEDHHYTAMMLGAEAAVQGALGHHAESIAGQREALATTERWFGPDSRRLARPLQNLALTESDAGRHGDAAAHARRALAIGARWQVNDEQRAGALVNLATVLANSAQPEAALPYFEEARAAFTAAKLPGAAGQSLLEAGAARAAIAARSGDARLAARGLGEVRAGRAAMIAAWGAEHAEVARAREVEAEVLAISRRHGGAGIAAVAAVGAADDQLRRGRGTP